MTPFAMRVLIFSIHFPSFLTFSLVLKQGKMNQTESVASSAVKTSRDVGATAIVVLTESGHAATCVAKYRPDIPVLVITHYPDIARQVTSYSFEGSSIYLFYNLSL